MKIAIFGGRIMEARFLCLFEYIKTLGKDINWEFYDTTPDNFLMRLENLVNSVQIIRLLSPYSELVLGFQNKTTDHVNIVGSADALVFDNNGSWWPQNYAYEAFTRVFIRKAKHIDLKSHVLVVGSGASARVSTAALINLGYTKFYVTDKSEEKAQKMIDFLKKHFFRTEFTFVSHPKLMSLPGSSSVLLNATPLRPDNELLKDLFYFNFLKSPATIIDLNIVPPAPPLIVEGAVLAASLMPGIEIAAATDTLWAKQTLNLDLDEALYLRRLTEVLGAIPFDPAPYRLS